MPQIRQIQRVIQSTPTLEGAGVQLRRAFGFHETRLFDPFLLFDDFRGDEPAQYEKGFPLHPHRGIETITYVLRGTVAHEDSLGNRGEIGAGDIQWMTAGSGIMHQEMPTGDAQGRMYGFQLWANLPKSRKMTAPRYQGVISSQVPLVKDEHGVEVRVICGMVAGQRGPIENVVINPEYIDVQIPPNGKFSHPTQAGHTVLAYVFEGEGVFSDIPEASAAPLGNHTLVVFGNGDEVQVSAGAAGVRFLLFSGKPIGEPIAWYGPIVMNTSEELQTAYEELQQGTFIKPV